MPAGRAGSCSGSWTSCGAWHRHRVARTSPSCCDVTRRSSRSAVRTRPAWRSSEPSIRQTSTPRRNSSSSTRQSTAPCPRAAQAGANSACAHACWPPCSGWKASACARPRRATRSVPGWTNVWHSAWRSWVSRRWVICTAGFAARASTGSGPCPGWVRQGRRASFAGLTSTRRRWAPCPPAPGCHAAAWALRRQRHHRARVSRRWNGSSRRPAWTGRRAATAQPRSDASWPRPTTWRRFGPGSRRGRGWCGAGRCGCFDCSCGGGARCTRRRARPGGEQFIAHRVSGVRAAQRSLQRASGQQGGDAQRQQRRGPAMPGGAVTRLSGFHHGDSRRFEDGEQR